MPPLPQHTAAPPAISIVIPAYNESEALGPDLERIIQTMDDSRYTYEIIVVDDGSSDDTANIARRYGGVQVIRHPYNRGTGAARTTGLRHARGDIIVMTDADGTYPNQDIPRMLEMMDGTNGMPHDMVIGARRQEKGTVAWLRAPTKWFIRNLAQYLSGTRIPDLNSGFRAFRKGVAERFIGILPPSHSWVSTITLAFLSEGYFVGYLPIDYYKRVGRSTFHPYRDTYNYLTLVVRTIMYFNPLKVFLPLAFFLVAVAIIKAVRDVIYYHGFYIPSNTVIIGLSGLQIGALGLLADLIVKRSKL
ncbi:MAG: glycosyltransferase family 2 protein [Chloroflexi bacterium]|nr:glycosyltransferase family 2 protein [Chloroflexota bacterium]